jgi:hypothetical protein
MIAENPFADLAQPVLNPFTEARVVGENINPETYHDSAFERGDKNRVISRSDLMQFAKCPHRWFAGYGDDDTRSKDWGGLVDCLLLTPQLFESQYAVKPLTYPADGKKKGDAPEEKPWNGNATWCRDWMEANKAKSCISHKELVEAQKAVALLSGDAEIADILKRGKRQVMLVATFEDAATQLKIPVKCLIDLVPDDSQSLCDLKTTTSAELDSWQKSVYSFGYHVQAAMYLDAWNAATGEHRSWMRHIVQENFSPYEYVKRIITEDYISIGRGVYTTALRNYCDCLASGCWPGYDADAELQVDGWTVVEPLPWMLLKSA